MILPSSCQIISEIEVEPVELEDGSLQRISNAFSVYPNYLQLECPENSVVKSKLHVSLHLEKFTIMKIEQVSD